MDRITAAIDRGRVGPVSSKKREAPDMANSTGLSWLTTPLCKMTMIQAYVLPCAHCESRLEGMCRALQCRKAS